MLSPYPLQSGGGALGVSGIQIGYWRLVRLEPLDSRLQRAGMTVYGACAERKFVPLRVNSWREKIMSDEIEFEEEEFSTQFNGQTVVRILAQTRPHWKWVVGFLVTVTLVAASEAYFTYLRKQIIDRGHYARRHGGAGAYRCDLRGDDRAAGCRDVHVHLSGGRAG